MLEPSGVSPRGRFGYHGRAYAAMRGERGRSGTRFDTISVPIRRCPRNDPARDATCHASCHLVRGGRLSQRPPHQQAPHAPHGRHRHLLRYCRRLRRQYVGTMHWGWPVVLVPSPKLDVNYAALVAAFVIIFGTGLLDDRFSLSPRQKLLGQVLAADGRRRGRPRDRRHLQPLRARGLRPPRLDHLSADGRLSRCLYQHHQSHRRASTARGGHLRHRELHDVRALRLGGPPRRRGALHRRGGLLARLPALQLPSASIFMGDSGALTLGFALGAVSLLR